MDSTFDVDTLAIAWEKTASTREMNDQSQYVHVSKASERNERMVI